MCACIDSPLPQGGPWPVTVHSIIDSCPAHAGTPGTPCRRLDRWNGALDLLCLCRMCWVRDHLHGPYDTLFFASMSLLRELPVPRPRSLALALACLDRRRPRWRVEMEMGGWMGGREAGWKEGWMGGWKGSGEHHASIASTCHAQSSSSSTESPSSPIGTQPTAIASCCCGSPVTTHSLTPSSFTPHRSVTPKTPSSNPTHLVAR